jgi:hypothetical protein
LYTSSPLILFPSSNSSHRFVSKQMSCFPADSNGIGWPAQDRPKNRVNYRRVVTLQVSMRISTRRFF